MIFLYTYNIHITYNQTNESPIRYTTISCFNKDNSFIKYSKRKRETYFMIMKP